MRLKWSGNLRGDGTTVKKEGDEWIIITRHGERITKCPCCDKPFPTVLIAMKVADVMQAMEQPQPE